MNSYTTKVFTAVAIGSFIGAFIALQLGPMLWWLGMLAGGLVGYLAYEFKTVLSATPKAWAKTKSVRKDPTFKLRIQVAFYFAASMMLFAFYFAIGMFSLLLYEINKPVMPLVVMISLVFIIALFPLMAIKIWETWDATEDQLRREVSYGRKIFWNVNPVIVIFKWVPLGIYRLLSGGIRFGRELFILIHSELRLLCGVDAAIGATIGYFAGNAVVGAVAGGLIGVLNYEVISKRVLHLAPRT